MMFHVKLMKNQMPVLIGQIHGDFKVTAYRVGSHVVFAWIHCTDVRIHCTDILVECR